MPNWSIWWEWRSDAKCHIICCVSWRIYIDTMGKKIVLMNLNGNGKMDSTLNILMHWKMLFWVRLAITSIWSIWKYPKSTKWLFLGDISCELWLILFCLHISLPPMWKIFFKLRKPFECIMKARYYLPPIFKKMACLSLIDADPFDGHPLKVGMVSWVS